MHFSSFSQSNGFDELLKLWNKDLDLHHPFFDGYTPEEIDEDVIRCFYQELAFLIQDQGESGQSFLISQLNTDNRPKLSALLSIIPPSNKSQVKNALLDAINSNDSKLIFAALEGSLYQEECQDVEIITPFLTHHDPFVRSSALRLLCKFEVRDYISDVKKALTDSHHIVVQSAIDIVDEQEISECFPLLKAFTKANHSDVREAAEYALQKIEPDD